MILLISELIARATEILTAGGLPDARLEAELLMARALKTDRAGLIVRLRDEAGGEASAVFADIVGRRASREPLQYITGVCEFLGRDFIVGPGVLIPRPETEALVEECLAVLGVPGASRPAESGAKVAVDIGTGSGCIAVSIALQCPDATVYAVDESQAALYIAGKNIARHGVADRIIILYGDLYAPIREMGLAGRVDLIVSNPPYIPTGELPGLQPEVRLEPSAALDGGPDGLDVIKRLVAEAPEILAPGGHILIEIGFGQADAVRALIDAQAGLEFIKTMDDFAGIGRVVVAKNQGGYGN